MATYQLGVCKQDSVTICDSIHTTQPSKEHAHTHLSANMDTDVCHCGCDGGGQTARADLPVLQLMEWKGPCWVLFSMISPSTTISRGRCRSIIHVCTHILLSKSGAVLMSAPASRSVPLCSTGFSVFTQHHVLHHIIRSAFCLQLIAVCMCVHSVAAIQTTHRNLNPQLW